MRQHLGKKQLCVVCRNRRGKLVDCDGITLRVCHECDVAAKQRAKTLTVAATLPNERFR
jgi:hypothetical protein